MKRALAAFGRLKLLPLLTLMAGSRVILLASIFALSHGHELGNDVQMHMKMIRSPLAILLFPNPDLDQHPPLLPMMEAALGYPLQLVFPDFLSIRVLMIVWEVFFVWIFFRLVTCLKLDDVRRGYCFAAIILLPTGWMTTTIMGQDDSIAACGVLLPILLFLNGRRKPALFMAGFGMIAAKLFVVLDLFALVSLSPKRKIARDTMIGLSAIVLIYGGMAIQRVRHSVPMPLVGFRPDVAYGTNFWVVLHNHAGVNLHRAGVYSGVIALVAACVPLYFLGGLPQKERNATQLLIATGACLLLFFSFFYHVEPEYFTMLLPVLLLSSENAGDALCCTAISILPWAGKFFQNATYLDNAVNTSGKYVALHLFEVIFRSSPATWLWLDQILFSVISIYVSARWCTKIRRAPGYVPWFNAGRPTHQANTDGPVFSQAAEPTNHII